MNEIINNFWTIFLGSYNVIISERPFRNTERRKTWIVTFY